MAERLTVLQVLPALEGGGVERGTLELAAGLVAAGHRSLVMSAGGQQVSRLVGQGSEHFTWALGRKSLFTLRHVKPLRAFLREQSVDILHVRSRMPAWVAYRAWNGMPQKQRPHFVTTVHGLYGVNAYSAVMTRGERVIAVSRAAADYLTQNYPKFDVAKLRLIERGIDRKVYAYNYRPPASWLQRWYQDFPYLLEREVLLLPGRITRLKGHLDFIGLMERLVRKGKPVYGLIAGGESREHQDYARELRNAIEQRKLGDYITFLGHRLDLRDIMAVSNLVLSLSQHAESFGRTVREALSLGVPVAAYDEGGVRESLIRAFPAGRVPPRDADALERTATRILEQRPQVAPCDFPSIQDMIDQTLAVYRKLVAG